MMKTPKIKYVIWDWNGTLINDAWLFVELLLFLLCYSIIIISSIMIIDIMFIAFLSFVFMDHGAFKYGFVKKNHNTHLTFLLNLFGVRFAA